MSSSQAVSFEFWSASMRRTALLIGIALLVGILQPGLGYAARAETIADLKPMTLAASVHR